MKKITAEILQELENNKDFVVKMQSAESAQDVIAIVKEYGVDATEAELEMVLANNALTTADGELSEDVLDNVSGGGLWSWLQKWIDHLSKKSTEELDKLPIW